MLLGREREGLWRLEEPEAKAKGGYHKRTPPGPRAVTMRLSNSITRVAMLLSEAYLECHADGEGGMDAKVIF